MHLVMPMAYGTTVSCQKGDTDRLWMFPSLTFGQTDTIISRRQMFVKEVTAYLHKTKKYLVMDAFGSLSNMVQENV